MDISAFYLTVPLREIILRGTIVFWFLFLIFRFILRRSMGDVGISDFLFVSIMADASQNAMSGDAKSIADGLALLSVLVVWNVLIDWLGYNSAWISKLMAAPPIMLVRNGVLQTRAMRREFITRADIMTKLREEGIDQLADVKRMQLETDGQISVVAVDKK